MKTRHLIILSLTICFLQIVRGADITATLDSTDGSSAFLVQNADSNEVLRASSDGNLAIGFQNNIANEVSSSVISGGRENNIWSGFDATIGGGWRNTVTNNAWNATIGGGIINIIRSSTHATIAGGGGNSIGDDTFGSTIGGGVNSAIQDHADRSTIGGGSANSIGEYAERATVSGGEGNDIGNYSEYATIGGGGYNDIGDYASSATIGGGYYNIIGSNATYATIPGGEDCAIGTGADYAFAAGRRAKANHQGSFVWADSTYADFSSTTKNQFLIRASGGVGIGTTATPELLTVAGNVKADSFIGDGAGLAGIASLSGDQNFDSGTLFIDSTNNRIGIGTTSPTGRLHIASAGAVDLVLEADTNNIGEDQNARIILSQDGGSVTSVIGLEGDSDSAFTGSKENGFYLMTRANATEAPRTFQVSASGANDFTIHTNANVGVGMDSAAQRLSVAGNILVGKNNTDSFLHGGGNIAMSSDGDILIVADANDTDGAAAAGDIIFGSGSSVNTDTSRDFTYADAFPARNEHMRVTGAGKVGIGITAPARNLHVKDVLRLEPRSSAPPSPGAGDMYIDSSDSNKLKVYDGTTWQACW